MWTLALSPTSFELHRRDVVKDVVAMLAPHEAGMQCKNGDTALMLVVGDGKSEESIRILIPYELHLRDSKGLSALCHAKSDETRQMLIDAGLTE